MLRSLIVKRVKYPFASKLWLKTWAKRLYHTASLTKLVANRAKLVRAGATIGAMTIIEGLPSRHNLKNLAIGDNSFLAGNVRISLHDKVTIGNSVVINSGSVILTASHDVSDPYWTQYQRPVVINDFAWVATNALILPGVTIGIGAVVGAGSVVRRDVPAGAMVSGNPATVHEKRRSKTLNYNPTASTAPIEAWLGPFRTPS